MESNGLDATAVRAEGQGLGGLRDVPAAGEPDVPPVKRKRGRPRKSEQSGKHVHVEPARPADAVAEGPSPEPEQQLRDGVEQPDSERVQLENAEEWTARDEAAYRRGFLDGGLRANDVFLHPDHRHIVAAKIDALIIDDPRAFNAWMTQGVVLLKQQAEEAKAARRPRGVMVEDGIEEMQSSGIPTDGPVGDGPARWAAKVAARHGVSRETSSVPEQYAPAPQASYDPNLASLVRAAVQEYMHGVSGTQLASPPPLAAGYGYPPAPAPVAPPPPFGPRPAFPSFWYDPRRR